MIRIVDETGSTNDDMAAWALAGAAEGDWLMARRQIGGRGRSGRAWTSPAGNLYASGLVRLAPGDPPAPTLALVAGVAAAEVIAAYLGPAGSPMLKWPNDVLVGGAKLAGILLERHGEAIVIGIGANLVAAPALPDRPTASLAALGGAVPAAEDALAELAAAFARWLAIWRGQGLEQIRRAWLAAAHPIGTALSAQVAGERIDGLFDGLDRDGALRLRHPEGVATVQAGDVFLIG